MKLYHGIAYLMMFGIHVAITATETSFHDRVKACIFIKQLCSDRDTHPNLTPTVHAIAQEARMHDLEATYRALQCNAYINSSIQVQHDTNTSHSIEPSEIQQKAASYIQRRHFGLTRSMFNEDLTSDATPEHILAKKLDAHFVDLRSASEQK